MSMERLGLPGGPLFGAEGDRSEGPSVDASAAPWLCDLYDVRWLRSRPKKSRFDDVRSEFEEFGRPSGCMRTWIFRIHILRVAKE